MPIRLFLILTCIASGALAQTIRGVEVFGGYSYTRMPAEPGGLTAANLNGWNAAVKVNFWSRAGWVFDFEGSYGRRRMVPSGFQPRETLDGGVRQHTVLSGPEIRLFTTRRLAANARVLIGALYVNPLTLPLKEPFAPGPPDPRPLVTQFTLGRAKPLAGAVGFSFDYRVTDHLSIRLLQSDLVVVSLGDLNLRRPRVSTGIVFTFGW
ncbi:MAG TPA: hypothetical protein VN442_06320 [Bryobacteraceae bacterium]|nr:hypothetical protein [Bryobacteraceae bacterium]